MLYRDTLLSLGWLSVTHSLNLCSHFQLNFQFLLTFSHCLIWAGAILFIALVTGIIGNLRIVFLATLQESYLGLAWHPLLRCIVLGMNLTKLLISKQIPYIGKVSLCLFSSATFLKASFFSQLCLHGFALLSPTLGPHSHPHPRCSLESMTVSCQVIRRKGCGQNVARQSFVYHLSKGLETYRPKFRAEFKEPM